MRRIRLLSSLLLLSTVIPPSVLAQAHAVPKERIPPAYLSGEESEAAWLYRKVLPTIVTISTLRQVVTHSGSSSQTGIGSIYFVNAFLAVACNKPVPSCTHEGEEARDDLDSKIENSGD